MFRVFTRTWWKNNTSGRYPNNLEPHMGRQTTLKYFHNEVDAQRYCQNWNDTHDPGRYSRKAEYTRS